MNRAFSAPDFSNAEAPLRMPAKAAVRGDLRIQAGRQLRMSLWMVAVLAVALTATLLARPVSGSSLTEFQVGKAARTASSMVPAVVAMR